MSGTVAPVKPIVCPFCLLHCDGMTIGQATAGSYLKCERFEDGVRRIRQPQLARIGHETVTLTQAIDAASQIHARTVAISPLSLNESRDLANYSANVSSLRWFTTAGDFDAVAASIDSQLGGIRSTIGDVKRHADVIVMAAAPSSETRQLRGWFDREEVTFIDACGEGIQWWMDLCSDRGRAFEVVETAKLAAFVVGPGITSDPADTLAVLDQLNRWSVNRTLSGKRTSMLRIENFGNIHTAWRTHVNSTIPPIPSGAIADFVMASILSDCDQRSQVQIGGFDPGQSVCEIFIPTAAVGWHLAGSSLRGDGSVAMPLQAVDSTELMPLIDVLKSCLVSLAR
ncbi:MAG: hypothetical protein AAF664_02625 [Planctomycetota bacterium]